MAIRNRTAEFKSSAKTRRVKFGITLDTPKRNHEAEVYVMDTLKKVEGIYKSFHLLDKEISDVIKIQTTILEFSDTDQRLHGAYKTIKDELVSISDRITGLSKTYDPDTFFGTPTEKRIIDTQILTLKKKLMTCLSYYYSIQEEYRDKVKVKLRRQAQIAGADISKLNINEVISSKTDVFLQAVFPDYDVSHHVFGDIKKRHEAFLQMEKNFEDLKEMLFDLSLIIQMDYALIDRIDKHSFTITKLVADGKTSTKLYRSSVKYSKFKRYMILGCCFVLVIFIIMVVVAFFFAKG